MERFYTTEYTRPTVLSQWSSQRPPQRPPQRPSQRPFLPAQTESDSDYNSMPELVSCNSLSSLDQDVGESPKDKSFLSGGYKKYLHGIAEQSITKRMIKIFGSGAVVLIFALIYFKKR